MCIRDRFYTDDYIFDVEKKDSIKTLLLTLWKSEDDKVTKTESGDRCRFGLGISRSAVRNCFQPLRKPKGNIHIN